MLRRIRLFLGGRPLAGKLATRKRIPRTAREDIATVLSEDAQQPARVPVPRSQGPELHLLVQPDPFDAHVLHHARVPGGW